MKIIMKKLTIAKNVPRSLQGKDTKEMPPLGQAFAEIMGPITSTIAQDVRQAKKQNKQKNKTNKRCRH